MHCVWPYIEMLQTKFEVYRSNMAVRDFKKKRTKTCNTSHSSPAMLL